MNSARYESPTMSQLEKIKYLADEMAKRKIQLIHEGEEIKEDNVFHKIMFASSIKHKSQIFFDRNKKKMLKQFSLNKVNNDVFELKNKLGKKKKKGKRRQSTMPLNKKNYKKCHSNIDYKKYSYSINQNNNQSNQNGEKVFLYGDTNSDSNFDSLNEDKEEEEEDEEEKDEESSNFYKNENKNNNNNKENDKKENNNNSKVKEKYEIIYVNPKELKNINDKENSTLNNNDNNNSNNKHKDRYLFDKEMKLLQLKNNKIEKKRQYAEKKIQDFFEVSNFLNKNSMEYIQNMLNNQDYRPIQYKAIEEHRVHLARIEMNQNKNNLRKRMEEKKEIDKTMNYHKLNKKNFDPIIWEDFVEKEYYWQEEKRKTAENIRNKINNQIKHKPNINKKSIIIFEKMNKRNINTNNDNNNVFTRLHNDQEKYELKKKNKREISMPSFMPKIYKSNNKSKNKRKKIIEGLNDINFIYKDKISSNKTVKNISNKNINSLTFDSKIKNKSLIKTSHSNFHKSSFEKISSQSSTNIYKPNKNNKKNINIVYNIDKEGYNEINYNKKSKDHKRIFLGLDESKNKINEKRTEKNIDEDAVTSIEKRNSKTKKDKIEENKEEKDFIMDERNDLITKICNAKYKKSNDENRLLYNLNIRDNTSNTIRENVVLTSYKYRDFFLINK